MNIAASQTGNSFDSNYQPRKKRSRHTPSRFKLKYFVAWLKRDFLKFLGCIAAIVLLYVTFLFVQFSKEQDRNAQKMNARSRTTAKPGK